MISSVKDLYPSLREKYDLSEFPGQGYAFPGQDVMLRSNSPELIALINAVYHEFKSGEGAGKDTTTLYLLNEKGQYLTIDPGYDSFVTSSPDQIVSFWGAQLMGNHLYRSHFLFLHSSVLAREGKAYIFPGESRAGKSTTILKLRDNGFSFFSDEFAVIDLASGLIHPFPRSFLLRGNPHQIIPELTDRLNDLPVFNDYQELDRETGEPIRRIIVFPELIYAKTDKKPVPVGGIFFLDKFRGETVITTLPAAGALEKIIDHSVNSRYLSPENQAAAISALTAILKDSPAFTLQPGPIDEDPKFLARTINRAVEDGQAIQTGDLDLVLQRIIQLAPGALKNRQGS
ncbi:MAG: hypothetical protein U9N73_11260 [Candidatus Auribacterota bacterium]|nr:hypothetical protein [Candidatus Auribacterota bacterium]